MKNFLKRIPGFRSEGVLKKVLSTIYYLFLTSTFLSGDLGLFLVMFGFGLFAFSIKEITSVDKKDNPVKVSVVFLLVAMLLFGMGTSSISNDTATAEDNKLIETLTEQNKELESQNDELKLKYESFENSNKDLESENKELKKDNQDLKDEIKVFEDEIEELKKDIESLQENVKDLEAKKEAEKKEQEKKVAAANQSPTTKTSASSSSGGNAGSGGSKSSTTNSPKPDNTASVLVTKTGKKYHRIACGNGNYYSDTLANAQARGLTPCAKCY